jgi:mannan endo-1,4-beta-mannosidase
MYWGAWVANPWVGGEAPWEMSALSAFAGRVGKAPSLVNFSSAFVDCRTGTCTLLPFPEVGFSDLRRFGAIPFFSWGSDSLPVRLNEPNFSLGTIIAGKWDSYITTWASDAKNWGHPFFLRFNWEMNGNWFPWSEGVNGNTSGQYVQAWRHVHDIFRSVGATNATWVWCPSADASKAPGPLGQFYPGDAYVDWTCLDGYNRGTPWKRFEQVFGSTYDLLTSVIAPSKPVVIGETASTERHGSKAAWITDMLSAQLQSRYRRVKAFLWFDKGASTSGWPIETSSSATAAFAAGVASSAYATNRFGSLGGGPIQPLP